MLDVLRILSRDNLISSFFLSSLHTPRASRALSVPCRIMPAAPIMVGCQYHLSPACSEQLSLDTLVLGLCFGNNSVHLRIICMLHLDQVQWHLLAILGVLPSGVVLRRLAPLLQG
jgi:hypothetical protein